MPGVPPRLAEGGQRARSRRKTLRKGPSRQSGNYCTGGRLCYRTTACSGDGPSARPNSGLGERSQRAPSTRPNSGLGGSRGEVGDVKTHRYDQVAASCLYASANPSGADGANLIISLINGENRREPLRSPIRPTLLEVGGSPEFPP